MIAKLKRSMWVGGIAVIAFGAIMGLMAMTVSVAHADKPDKVFVCKYVGTPHVDERLQTGQNPISVSVNSIQNNEWDGTVPGWFSDAHDRSYVLAYDTGQAEPSVSSCPAPETPHDASASVSVNPATCDAAARLVYGPAVYATYSGTPDGTFGPGTYNVTATADAGHLFASNGLSTLLFSGSLAGELPAQNTNPNGACYFTLHDATAVVMTVPATCDAAEQLRYGATTFATFTAGTANNTYGPGSYSVTATAAVGHTFANSQTTLTFSGSLADKLTQGCGESQGSTVATANVNILPATCKVGQTLVYANVAHAAATAESTADGSTGPKDYTVTFTADNGTVFDAQTHSTSLTFKGTLTGPSTAPSCEEGQVLGETTSGGSGAATGTPAAAVAQLPETDGEATAVIAVGGSLLAVVAGFAGIRRFLTRGL